MPFERASAPGRSVFLLPELGLLLLTPLVIYRGFPEQFTGIKVFLTESLVTASATLAIVLWMRGKSKWPRGFALAAPLGLLSFGVLASCLTGPSPKFRLVEASYFLCGPVWALTLVSGGGGKPRIKRLCTMVALAGTAVAVVALLQWAGYDPLLFGGYHVEWGNMRNAMRLYSTLGNPNFVSGYLIGAIFPTLALAGTSRSLGGRLASIAAALAMLAAVIGTRSRGAWLALAVGLLAARLIFRENSVIPQRSSPHPSSLLGTILPLLLLALGGGGGLIHIALGRLQGRIFLWRAAWPMFEAHPFFGSGWATFQLRFPELQAKLIAAHPELAGYWTHTAQLHNDLLQILYEAGAIGFVAFLWLLWRYARSLRSGAAGDCDTSVAWLKASTGGAIALMVNSLFNFQFATPPTFILLFTFLAFPSLLRSSEPEPRTLQSTNPPSTRSLLRSALAACLAIALALWYGFNIKNRVSADRALALGLEDERRGEFVSAEAQFRDGLRMSPHDGRLHYGLARALFVQEYYAEALAHVLRARQTVADAHLEVLRARIIDLLGYGPMALEAYRYALWLNPQLKSVPADIERLSGTQGR